MAFSLLVHALAVNGGAGTATTAARDTTGAKLITLVTTGQGTPTPTDSAGGNTWLLAVRGGTGVTHCDIWYCFNPTTSATHTFSRGATLPGIVMYAWAGVPSALDQTNSNEGSSVSVLTTGSITPVEDNELAIAGALCSSVDPNAVNSSFTLGDHIVGDGATYFGTGLAYQIQIGATTRNPEFTFSGSAGTAVAAIASFKLTAPAGKGRMFSVF